LDRLITNPRIDSFLKAGQVQEALAQPIRQSTGIRGFVGRSRGPLLGLETTSYASLTLGEFLYDYIRIDPTVVRGVEFARSADVDSVLSFARFADTKADLAGQHLQGLTANLHGYVAEQVAAQHLVAQGHDVLFPTTPNNPGWDLLVDGHPFQVKCLADSAGVLEHIQKYPDIPIIVNEELAAQVGDHAGVYVDPALHHDAVWMATTTSLEHGRELADFEIPWISLGVSGAFNFYYLLRGDTDLSGMLTCTASDTAGRTAAGWAGKAVGATLGLFLFGPAGAIIGGGVGAVGGASAGRRMAQAFRRVVLIDTAVVDCELRALADAAAQSMPDKIAAWQRKRELMDLNLKDGTANRRQIHRAMQVRISEHIVHWSNKQRELEQFARASTSSSKQDMVDCLLKIVSRAGIHPHTLQKPLRNLFAALKEFLAENKRFHTARA
jgi:hypothetical protein